MKRALSLLPLILALGVSARSAQELEPPPPVQEGAATRVTAVAPSPSLKDGLPMLDWDPVRRGPLLLIAPDKALLNGQTLPPPRNGYGLPELLGYFALQSARFPTLMSAGPITMTVLATPQVPRLNGMQEYFREAQPLPVLASLEPSQLQQALSPSGLGYASLNSEHQRALWEKMLPMTLSFREVPPSGPQPGLLAGESPWWGKQRLPVLAPAAQRNLRLRLRLDLTLRAHPGGYEIPFTDSQGGFAQVALKALPLPPDQLDRQRQEKEKLSSLQKIPYRRKPSDLDPADPRWAVPIPLDGVETVGALTGRIAQALRIELYADKRIVDLPVYVRAVPNQTVSAGDALGAILRATCFTVRHLTVGQESAFVISFDRVPLGNQSVAVFDNVIPQMLQEMQTQLSSAQDSSLARRKLREKNLLKILPRGAGAPMPELLWKAGLADQTDPIALSRLPAELQDRAQAAWTRVQAQKQPDGTPPPLRPQGVLPSAVVHVSLVEEGLGASEVATLSVKDLVPAEPLPRVALPLEMKTRSVLVNPPPDPASARRLIALARGRGFNQLAVSLSGDANDDTRLGWLLAEKDALPVVAVLSPLMPAPTDTQRERDLSVTGRTAVEFAQGRAALGEITKIIPFIAPVFRRITRLDALTPEAVPVDRFASRVARLASQPGVVGISIQPLTTSGYDGTTRGDMETLWTGGYSLSERLAFLRSKGSDPSDFLEVSGFGGGDLSLPFFGTGRDAQFRLWNERRKARGDQLRKRLDAALQAARVTKPLWLSPGDLLMEQGALWKPWKGGTPGPTQLPYWQALARRMPSALGGSDEAAALDDIGALRVWLGEQLRATPSADGDVPVSIRGGRGVTPAGFVLDLSDLDFAESLGVIEGVVAPVAATLPAP